MRINTFSIVIPVYNEKRTIKKILKKIANVNLGQIKKEIIIVDDGSTDGTKEILKNFQNNQYKIFFHKRNQGKGAALKTGFKHATGEIIITQDADLEYDPNDYKKIINVFKKNNAQVVYGSRNLERKNKLHSGWHFYTGGLILTWLTNFLYNTKITDEPTGYKAFEKDLLNSIKLKSAGFEFCPEITAKIAKRKIKIYEVPIKYYPRTKQEGKHINCKDGLKAIWTLLKYRFAD